MESPKEHEYDGSLTAIWELLVEVKTTIDSHISEEKDMKPQLLELLGILNTSKSAMVFIKYTAKLVAVAVATYTFMVIHITWKG